MSYITSLWRKTAIPEKKVYNYIPRERDEPRRFFPLGPAAGGTFSEMELSRRHFPYINSYFSIFCKHSVRISVRGKNGKDLLLSLIFKCGISSGSMWQPKTRSKSDASACRDALSYLSFPSSKYTAVFVTVNHLQYFWKIQYLRNSLSNYQVINF